MLLKIIYKSFYKTRDRKENTKNGFIGLAILYLLWTIIIVLVEFIKHFFPNVKSVYILLLSISTISILSIYIISNKYVKKQFKNESFYNDIKLSLLLCRTIYISICIIGAAYIPCTHLIWRFIAGYYK